MHGSRAIIISGVLLASLFTAQPAGAEHQIGLFELDGNAMAGVAAGDDWSSLFPTNTSTTVFNASWTAEPASNDTTYFSVASKDIDDIGTWTVDGNSAPPKDEIVNAFAAAYNSTTAGSHIYFGADRWANNGDAAVGFWFLQDGFAVGPDGDVNGTHVDNDTFVVSHFTNGGAVATIYVYKWLWTADPHLVLIASGQDCTLVSADTACARTNGALVPSAVPYQGSGSKDPANQYPANSFFEGGINLTSLYGGTPPCFSRFVAETRSSQETTATLKDIAYGSFNNCPVVPPQAIITVEKTALPPVVDIGTNVTFGITVTNSGPDPADNTILWDDLPVVSGAWAVSGPDAGDCAITGVNLTCLFGTVEVFGQRSIVLSAATGVAPGDCGAKPNTVRITANDGLANDQSFAEVYVTCADVSLVKTADASPIHAGQTAGFTLTLTSLGPDAAVNVTLDDTLPAIAGSWSSAAPDGGSCAIVLGVLSCTFGTLAPGVQRNVTLSAPTAFEDCGLLPNDALAGAGVDTNAANNAAIATILVLCPDLSIQKVADDASVSAGEPIGFTITVSNGGPGTAFGVTLTDALPAGAALDWSIDPAVTGCAITGTPPAQTLACDLGDLAANASASVHVTTATAFADCAAIPNTASTNATNHAVIEANDSTTVLCPDLDILKTADDASVSAGQPIGFTITVSNAGPGTAFGVTLSDPLPGGSGIDWSITPPVTGCSITGTAPAQTLTCDIGDLGDDASASVHVSSATSFASCAQYSNTASANATNHAVVQSNDSTTVLCPDLNILKSADDATVSAGEAIGFTITVDNSGAGTSLGVTLSDPLPGGSGVDWSISPPVTGCSITGTAPAQTLECTLGDLATNASVSVHVTSGTSFASCAEYPNTATASASNHANVTASDSTTVLCPDLDILKSADDATVSAGESIGFTITVSNAGPGTAFGVTLSDPLPGGSGVAWSIDPANTDCAITGSAPAQALECAFGDLAAEGSASVHVTSGTAFASCAEYPNTASANATNHAAVEANASTTVLCPDLDILKSADDATVSAGESIGFTITVSNAGPGTAFGVTLSDPLPGGSGVDWSIDPANTDCAITGSAPTQTLECAFGDLAAEGSASVHVTSGTTFASCAEYPNTASANATNHAAVEANASTTVLCPDLDISKTADDASVSAGSDIGFTITVENNGVGTAFGATLTDALPGGSGIDWSISPAVTGCAITGTPPAQTLACSFGDLAPEASVGVHVTSGTAFASCAEYPNTASTNATNHAAVEASASTTVLCPDLDVLKTADAASVSAGESIGFTVTVSNAGPGVATGVTLSDPLPGGSGVDWSIDPANADCSITGSAPVQSLECDFGDLGDDASASVHVTSGTAFASCAGYPNTATASASNHANVTASNSTTVLCPDLDILKTADAASVSAGSSIGFTIGVSNAGPGTAFDVTLSDPLPGGSGVDWSIDPANTDCAITGSAPAQSLECDFGDLADDASVSVHVTSATSFASCAEYPNTATADASNHASVESSASTDVLCPDLSLLKLAVEASVSAGSEIAFDIVVENAGLGTATDVALSDPLPGGSGINWSIDPAVTGCAITGTPPAQTLECDFGDLVTNASVSIHIESATEFASCASYPNVATVSASNHADVTANDTIVVLCPDLDILKSADDASVSAGSDIGFTITVENNGAGVATSVTLSDPLPGGSGVDWSIDPANADCSITGTAPAQTLECDFGDLASGGSAGVHVTSGTAFASCAEYPNTATADATNHAAVEANATTTVLCPDLDVLKTADDATVNAGESIGFTITVSNAGPGVATDANLSDLLPGGSGVDWSIDPAVTGCEITGTPPAQLLECDFGDLASGASVEIHVTSGTAFASCAEYPNTATADASNHASVEASASTTVLCPDLDVLKTADAANVSAGEPIGFTMTVSNGGPGTAVGANLSDPLPGGNGLDWSIDPANADCAITGTAPSQTLECDFGDLASEASASVHVTSGTSFASCAEYTNTASASASNHASIESTDSTTVLCPDLDVLKSADAANVTAGSPIGFTLTVTNTGPGTALGSTLVDALPGGSGINWSIDPANTDCAITGAPPNQTLECAFGDLAEGENATVHVVSPTTPASCAEYPNNATAGATNHANVTASASTTVECPREITRTQGFWASHTAYTQRVFDEALGGTMTVGAGSHVRVIDTDGKLFGAWLSSVTYKTDGQKRNQIDHARMVLLQQLVTAKLNCNAFGCSSATADLIIAADTAYAGNNKALMANLTAQLDAYNNGGDSEPLPPDYGAWNPATPALSSALANRAFWNSP